jgi:hypothetical protein
VIEHVLSLLTHIHMMINIHGSEDSKYVGNSYDGDKIHLKMCVNQTPAKATVTHGKKKGGDREGMRGW